LNHTENENVSAAADRKLDASLSLLASEMQIAAVWPKLSLRPMQK